MNSEISSRLPAVTLPRPTSVEKSGTSGKTLLETRQPVAADEPEAHAQAVESEPRQSDEDEIQASVTRLNEYVQNYHRELQFNVDEQSGRTVIKVVDAETDEVIRQIPAEEMLVLAQQLAEGKPFGFFEELA